MRCGRRSPAIARWICSDSSETARRSRRWNRNSTNSSVATSASSTQINPSIDIPKRNPVVLLVPVLCWASMPAGSLSERGKRPCDINHKSRRYADCVHAESAPSGTPVSGRISIIPVKELHMQIEFARGQMITQQVRAWDVLDERVLDAMRRTPREFFVPERYAGLAFADAEIPLRAGQHMLAPKIVGRLLQALDAQPGMRALVVGCGTGFVPACMSAMGASVRAVEIDAELAAAAQRNLKGAGFGQVEVTTGDIFHLDFGTGYALIAVCGALPLYDERFARALSVGGKAFVVVGASLPQEALLVTRTEEQKWDSVGLFETAIDPLDSAPRPEPFQF